MAKRTFYKYRDSSSEVIRDQLLKDLDAAEDARREMSLDVAQGAQDDVSKLKLEINDILDTFIVWLSKFNPSLSTRKDVLTAAISFMNVLPITQSNSHEIFLSFLGNTAELLDLFKQLRAALQRPSTTFNHEHDMIKVGGDGKGITYVGSHAKDVVAGDSVTANRSYTTITVVSIVGVACFLAGGYVGSVNPTLFENLFGIKSLFGSKK